MECIVCGTGTTTIHHLLFGHGIRSLCDEDFKKGIPVAIPLCDGCHTLSNKRLHDNPVAEKLSKMYGQSEWEKWFVLNIESNEEEARRSYIRRYGRSFL